MTTETIPASAPETVPFEPTTPIKPSEAIRLGCLIAPVQAFGGWFPSNDSACALGAMQIGFGGGRIVGFGWPEAYTKFRQNVRLPLDGEMLRSGHALMVLNDRDHWTRERIADWLEGLGL